MDEQRKHAILFAATLRSARKLVDWSEMGKPTMAKQFRVDKADRGGGVHPGEKSISVGLRRRAARRGGERARVYSSHLGLCWAHHFSAAVMSNRGTSQPTLFLMSRNAKAILSGASGSGWYRIKFMRAFGVEAKASKKKSGLF
jgi:hypothetical protein